jgi:hypothetical protein
MELSFAPAAVVGDFFAFLVLGPESHLPWQQRQHTSPVLTFVPQQQSWHCPMMWQCQ